MSYNKTKYAVFVEVKKLDAYNLKIILIIA